MGTANLLFVKPKPATAQIREEEVKRCLTCSVTFADAPAQKAHFKSEWHLYNIKRKNSQLPAIAQDEYLSIKNQIQDMIAAKTEKSRPKTPPGGNKSDLTQTPYSTPVRSLDLTPKSTIFNPAKCLFSDFVSKSVSDNVTYMETHYTFFLPEKEYITDLEGLLRHLHVKIYENRTCLYCNRQFSDHYAALRHMVDKQHHKLNDDRFDEIAQFYDFVNSYVNLIASSRSASSLSADSTPFSHGAAGAEDEWEDLFSTTSSPTRIEDMLSAYGLRRAYIMDNGNLSLPNGKEAVHRELSYVYKQNLVVQSPSFKNKQDKFKFKKKAEKRQIIMCQNQEHFRIGKRDLNVAIKGNKLFVPVNQNICFV